MQAPPRTASRQYRFLIEAYAIRPVVLHQHGAHVVASTVRERRGDQRIGGSIRRVVSAQDLRDLRILELVVETVAAQEQPVALAQRLRDRRRLRRSDAERLRDQVLVRMAAQLRLREILLLAQHFEIGMIAGQLAQRAAAQQVGAAVADPGDLCVTILDANGDDSRTHVRVSGVVGSGLRDLFVRSLHCGSQRQVQRVAEQRLLDDAARDVAAGVSAHAVRDEVQPVGLVPADRVLVLPSPSPWMCARGVTHGVQNARCAFAAALANC